MGPEVFFVFYFPLLKKVVYLIIFYRPTPQVDWNKIGGDLPKGRETKENYGKTLKIENVSYQDKGNYRCTASNFLGTATHDFHVIVEGTFPMFVYFPAFQKSNFIHVVGLASKSYMLKQVNSFNF